MNNIILKILIGFIIIIWILINLVYKTLIYDPRIIKNYWFDFLSDFKNNYINYFYYKNEQPVFVWNDNVFKEYVDFCFENNQNCIIFPFQKTYADFIWLSSIQYVWSVSSPNDLNNLYKMLDNLTYLSPFRDYPYIFWELLIPVSKNDLTVSIDQKIQKWTNAISLWEKWIRFNCNSSKINNIKNISYSWFFDSFVSKDKFFDENKNPCFTYELPLYLWFNYFFYLWDFENSAKYYKIASMDQDAPEISAAMIPIVYWKSWEHIKSLNLWISKYFTLKNELNKNSTQQKVEIIEKQMDEAIRKAVFELHLHFLKTTNEDLSDKNWYNLCYFDYKCLVEKLFLKKSINTLVNQCELDFWKNGNDFKIDFENIEKYENNVVCMVLWYSLVNWYTNFESWKLNYPFSSDDIPFTYFWDDELKKWSIKITNS